MTSVADFDPNSSAAPLWGVYDGHKFRTYQARGHALVKLGRTAPAKLFELTATGWALRAYRSTEPQLRCDCCGKSIVDSDSFMNRNQWVSGRKNFGPYWPHNYRPDRHNGKVTTPLVYLFACTSCIKARGL